MNGLSRIGFALAGTGLRTVARAFAWGCARFLGLARACEGRARPADSDNRAVR